jgi:chaperonin GroEL (HSP60 family)
MINPIDLKVKLNSTLQNSVADNDDQDTNTVLAQVNKTNIVSGDHLRKIQIRTLNETKDYLSKTFGPMGSNTKIITGAKQKEVKSAYSKDGLKVLESIINSAPIEASIVEELVTITKHVESEVGDGTTSTIILSALIFEKLTALEKMYNVPPYELIRRFQKIVDIIKANIQGDMRECTLDDIWNISYISTNGNKEVADNIRSIYAEYGMKVDLSVSISNTADSMTKVYDGLTITEGYSDSAYINNRVNNTAEIHDANIYYFSDPVDDLGMIAYFDAILRHNIYDPIENGEDPIPTVITCPKISRDLSVTLKTLVQQLYTYDQKEVTAAKPPVLVITNVVASDEDIMSDIANLCGCKEIKKYVDPKVMKLEQDKGLAPTIDNIHEFCGHAELVVADEKKTKFINPQYMKVHNEDGTVEDNPIYTSMVNYLENEIEQEKNSESANSIGLLKKRLSALKANMVEYLVGGVTIAERDSKKDLVEDAIKNCKSASLYGIGYAANFEGLYWSAKEAAKRYEAANEETTMDLDTAIAGVIYSAYFDITSILYNTVTLSTEDINTAIAKSLESKKPYNISSGSLASDAEPNGDDVLCSIMLDVNILDTLSKIITIMVTCNQCLLPGPQYNVY